MTRTRAGFVLAVAMLAACGDASSTGQAPADPPVASDGTNRTAPPAAGQDEGAPGAEQDGTGPAAPQPPDPAPMQNEPPATPTAPPVEARCDKTKPFGAPMLVTGLNTAVNETNARLSTDELTVYLARPVTTTDIQSATRKDLSSPWSDVRVLTPPSGTAEDGAPTVTADGLVMYFHSNRTPTTGDYDIWVTRRASTEAAWGTPARVPAINSTARDAYPYMRPDNKMMVFASTRSGNYDLYVAYVDETGQFGAARALTPLVTPAEESSPVVTPDGLTLYFMRRGTSADIFVSRRAKLDEPFGAPTLVAEVSTKYDERPSWISADECLLYLTSSGRPGSVGASDVYVAQRPK